MVFFFQLAKLFRHVGIADLQLGQFLPVVTKTYYPYEDERGIWVDFDIEYQSDFEAEIRAQGVKFPSKKMSHTSTQTTKR